MTTTIFWLQDVDFEDPKTFGSKVIEKAKLLAANFPVEPGFVVTTDFFNNFSKTDLLNFYSALTATKNHSTTGFKKLITSLSEPTVSLTVSHTGESLIPHPGFANFTQALKDLHAKSNSPLLVGQVSKHSDEVTISSGDPIVIKTMSGIYTTSKKSPQLIDLESLHGKKTSRSSLTKVLNLFFDLEKFYFFPISVNFTVAGSEIFVSKVSYLESLQTTQENFIYPKLKITNKPAQTFFVGFPKSPGLKAGNAKIIKSRRDLRKVKFGDVLIVKESTFDFLDVLRRCSGLVTESELHTAQVSRHTKRLGIPCVIGIPDLTSKLRDHQVVKLNGKTGEVWL